MLAVLLGGCGLFQKGPRRAPLLIAPYQQDRVWAVAPLRNESGSLEAKPVEQADQLSRQLEQAAGLSVLPVNRVLAAMDALKMSEVGSPRDATRLRQTLGVDGLVVGTISAYDPYDPPKLGMAIELYNRSPGETSQAGGDGRTTGGPASVVSAFFDASDPDTRKQLKRYAINRGPDQKHTDWRLYRQSMALYSEFVTYQMSSRLLHAEADRLRATHRESSLFTNP